MIRTIEKGTIIHRPMGVFYWNKTRGIHGIKFNEPEYWTRYRDVASGRVIMVAGSLVIIDFGEEFYWIANAGLDFVFDNKKSGLALAAPIQRDVEGFLREKSYLHKEEYLFIKNPNYPGNHKLRLEKIGVSS